MRAALAVVALARSHRLTVGIVPVAEPGRDRFDSSWLSEYADRVEMFEPMTGREAVRAWLERPASRELLERCGALPELARGATPELGAAIDERLGRRFDTLYVLRLYLAGMLVGLDGFTAADRQRHSGPSVWILDADDDDVATLRSLAAISRDRSEDDLAGSLDADAAAYLHFGSAVLPWFDRVLAASERDALSLASRHGLESVEAIENAVAIPPADSQNPGAPGGKNLLLLGNFHYLPNLDAAERLVHAVLPMVRADHPETQVDLVGKGPRAALERLARTPGVSTHGWVADLAPFYRRASATVVPTRAGGGSHVKILEAFAWGVPVVTTPEGSAGLGPAGRRFARVGATSEDLARAAGELIAGGDGARRQAERALRWVRAHHERSVVSEKLAAVVAAARAGTTLPGC